MINSNQRLLKTVWLPLRAVEHVLCVGVRILFVNCDGREALSGNKILKLHHWLYSSKYNHVKNVVSRGGNQSNAMYAIHQLCVERKWNFNYFTTVPKHSVHPQSNFAKVFHSNAGNATVFDANSYDEHVRRFDPSETLVIPQGACCPEAQDGVDLVAEEIHNYAEKELCGEPLNLLLPSGTGTTCAFFAKYFAKHQSNVKVWTVPCVGKTPYLYDQIYSIIPDRSFIENNIHTIESKSKYRNFAQPHPDLLHYWNQFQETYNVELDLIYAPKTLLTFNSMICADATLQRQNWLYLHTGGVTGNVSQLARYQPIIQR